MAAWGRLGGSVVKKMAALRMTDISRATVKAPRQRDNVLESWEKVMSV